MPGTYIGNCFQNVRIKNANNLFGDNLIWLGFNDFNDRFFSQIIQSIQMKIAFCTFANIVSLTSSYAFCIY